MSLCNALNRTLLLMRDEISDSLSDNELLSALTETRVVLIADERNLKTHSAQSAYVTTALLLLRSGHQVILVAPNVELLGRQPPLGAGRLIDQLVLAAPQILPGMTFSFERSSGCNVAIVLGDAEWSDYAIQKIRLNATSWQARIATIERAEPWSAIDWPIGGMGAAALGASEVFKSAMRRLRFAARDPIVVSQLFEPSANVAINLAVPGTKEISSLGQIDFVSGGAINSGALYVLLRLPGLSGSGRIIEDDIVSLSNLNRGMLFLLSKLELPKAEVLADYASETFPILPVVSRFEPEPYAKLGQISDAVLVGVDDIRARWHVQRAWPKWLGIGATTHFNSMASFHTEATPCAGCLHPKDDPTELPIPTVAFVSFWAGLWLASLYLRHLAGDNCIKEQQLYFSPPRPEYVWRSPVQRRADCPVECDRNNHAHLSRYRG
jgi:hypothetical protein